MDKGSPIRSRWGVLDGWVCGWVGAHGWLGGRVGSWYYGRGIHGGFSGGVVLRRWGSYASPRTIFTLGIFRIRVSGPPMLSGKLNWNDGLNAHGDILLQCVN